jgi:hypothetical protein
MGVKRSARVCAALSDKDCWYTAVTFLNRQTVYRLNPAFELISKTHRETFTSLYVSAIHWSSRTICLSCVLDNRRAAMSLSVCILRSKQTKNKSPWYDLRFSRRWLWRMASSRMLRRVALVRTDVSEELSASFIRLTRNGELGTTLTLYLVHRFLSPW